MHGFSAVDRQERPEDWVSTLDILAAEPFYARYQRRVRDLLLPYRGGRFLDVGAGTGWSASRLIEEHDVYVVTLDSSVTMSATQRSRGLRAVVTADGSALPFPSSVFDGASADRTIQHVADPDRCLDELIRVTRSGGRVVLADPDYSTQTLEIADQGLAAVVLEFRAKRGLRNGTLAHRYPGTLVSRGIVEVTVDALTVVVRDPQAYDGVWGLRSWARPAAASGFVPPESAAEFERQVDEAVASAAFTYSVTFFIAAGTVPG